ncbi:MAG: NAD(P)H-hydrate epimerase, partial [Halioglobus sp.]|nr:NAD(P)H-hydrate epimerase [Halioglobus sp.]
MQNNPSNRSANGIFSAAEVRAIDRAAIDAGIAGIELMSRAARFALDTALSEFPLAQRWQIVCGAGNNAGDGYLLAKLASHSGIDVSVAYLTEPDTLNGDARRAWQAAVLQGVPIVPFNGALRGDATLLVDAILGSGLTRAVEGRFAEAVRAINAHNAPCLALDIPTGLHGDSGKVLGVAVRAGITVCFVGRKNGLYFHDGPEECGRVRFSSLGIPPRYYPSPALRLADESLIRAALPVRKRQTNKGDYGHVLVIGGGQGMPGAVRLAGEAALRSGAGRVSIATCPQNSASVAGSRPELMCHEITRAKELAPLLDAATVVATGPGLGTGDWARA